MVRLPVLKPRQVIAALERLGFVRIRQRGSHSSFDTLTAAQRRSRITKGATSHLAYCARSSAHELKAEPRKKR